MDKLGKQKETFNSLPGLNESKAINLRGQYVNKSFLFRRSKISIYKHTNIDTYTYIHIYIYI